MAESDRAIPFGLLFEEWAPEPQSFIAPTYDEGRDLSYVEDPQGQWIPYVEFGGALGTTSVTNVRKEDTDTDPEDDRADLYVVGATATHTKVKAESTDADPDDDREYRPVRAPLVGTHTVTEVRAESTDKD